MDFLKKCMDEMCGPFYPCDSPDDGGFHLSRDPSQHGQWSEILEAVMQQVPHL